MEGDRSIQSDADAAAAAVAAAGSGCSAGPSPRRPAAPALHGARDASTQADPPAVPPLPPTAAADEAASGMADAGGGDEVESLRAELERIALQTQAQLALFSQDRRGPPAPAAADGVTSGSCGSEAASAVSVAAAEQQSLTAPDTMALAAAAKTKGGDGAGSGDAAETAAELEALLRASGLGDLSADSLDALLAAAAAGDGEGPLQAAGLPEDLSDILDASTDVWTRSAAAAATAGNAASAHGKGLRAGEIGGDVSEAHRGREEAWDLRLALGQEREKAYQLARTVSELRDRLDIAAAAATAAQAAGVEASRARAEGAAAARELAAAAAAARNAVAEAAVAVREEARRAAVAQESDSGSRWAGTVGDVTAGSGLSAGGGKSEDTRERAWAEAVPARGPDPSATLAGRSMAAIRVLPTAAAGSSACDSPAQCNGALPGGAAWADTVAAGPAPPGGTAGGLPACGLPCTVRVVVVSSVVVLPAAPRLIGAPYLMVILEHKAKNRSESRRRTAPGGRRTTLLPPGSAGGGACGRLEVVWEEAFAFAVSDPDQRLSFSLFDRPAAGDGRAPAASGSGPLLVGYGYLPLARVLLDRRPAAAVSERSKWRNGVADSESVVQATARSGMGGEDEEVWEQSVALGDGERTVGSIRVMVQRVMRPL